MMSNLILSPLVNIIPNKGRNILYSVDEFFHSPEVICPLSPSESLFLLLFDGTRTKEQVACDYLRIFKGLEFIDVDNLIDDLKTKLRMPDLFVDSSSMTEEEIELYGNRVDPLSLIVPKDELCVRNGDLRIDFPLSLNFNVATSCPFACEYCYHPLNRVEPFIPFDRLTEILRQFKEVGCASVMLTGGDPLLRPDIDDVLSFLHSIDFFYALSTKSIISDSRIDKLIDSAGLDRIQISLDSDKQEIVERLIHAKSGYFESCIHQIEYMLKKGLDVRVKSVLTSLNADYVGEYIDFFYNLGIKHIQVVSYGRSGSRHKDDLFATEDQLKYASDAVENAKRKYPDLKIVGGGYSIQKASPVGNCEIFDNRSICNAGRFAVTMLPNGEVIVCEQLPYEKKYIIGDLSKEDLMDWWNGPELKKWLTPPDRKIFAPGVPCYNCPKDDYDMCHQIYSRCLRYCREYFGSTEMPDVRCPKAEFNEFRIE